jgi:hypothetical protein
MKTYSAVFTVRRSRDASCGEIYFQAFNCRGITLPDMETPEDAGLLNRQAFTLMLFPMGVKNRQCQPNDGRQAVYDLFGSCCLN